MNLQKSTQIPQIKMTKFWRLFTSDYLQDFIDTASIPSSEELVETYRSQFDKGIKIHKEKITSLF